LTTIAWDGLTLAGDRMCSFGATPVPTTKVFSVKGVLFGTAGLKKDGILFREWIERYDRAPSRKPSLNENFSGMLIESSGELTYYGGPDLVPIPMPSGHKWSLGSGCDYALGAMEAGASAREAVEIASKLDINTGLGVDEVKL